jgi:tRNA (mo5U34)-methyltransferase
MSSSPEDLPATPDDSRLRGWYHTIDLGGSLVSQGFYDHRPVVDRYGLPESLAGKTALDVGPADGFFAFEMERRGADVTTADVAKWGDFDWLPHARPYLGEFAEGTCHLDLAIAMRGSSVTPKICSVYDISPETVGTFDVVFCGSLLLHLQNPIKALVAIRSVTREMAVIETTVNPEIDRDHPGRPWLSFGHREHETRLGSECVYWKLSAAALQEMLEYAGFEYTRATEPFSLPPHGLPVRSVVAYPTRPDGALPKLVRAASNEAVSTSATPLDVVARIDALEQRLEECRHELHGMRDAAAHSGDASLSAQLLNAQTALDQLLRSRSWRLLAPARTSARILRRVIGRGGGKGAAGKRPTPIGHRR